MNLQIDITLNTWGGFCHFEGESFNEDYYNSGQFDYHIKAIKYIGYYITYLIPSNQKLEVNPETKGIKITTNEFTIKRILETNNKFGLYSVKTDEDIVKIDDMIWFYLGVGTDFGLFEEIEEEYFEKYLQQ